MKHIGVLALQGAVQEHLNILKAMPGINGIAVKSHAELLAIDGLILPGGESTAIGKLLEYFQLLKPLKNQISQGLPTWGTCAGLILLAKKILDQKQTYLQAMDITVRRNAYGSQLDSFKTQMLLPEIAAKPLPLVFIRAPYIAEAASNVKILATVKNNIVAAQQNNLLATSFHPELTKDTSFHHYFINNLVNH